MTALRQALTAGIAWPTPAERRRAWRSFERALDRHLATRPERRLRPIGTRR
ncbi:MAG TPA: hypothetical protein VK896_13530 [Gaiellaceae bacterium]|nr:hypothetical protein [Gaiellaceae bacterium]HSJ95049.1 hypothetical protein [Gaiellaceae bacterium]